MSVGTAASGPLRLVILSDEDDLRGLTEILGTKLPGHPIDAIRTRSDLDAVAAEANGPIRLLSFCSSVIVPGAILRTLGATAYNIHPGSPAYPGSFPACWAVYEQASRFGATLHRMESRVDEGGIVDVRWCDVDPQGDSSRLARQASNAAFKLLMRWAPRLLEESEPAAAATLAWSGPKRRVSDLARIDPRADHLDEAERGLRERAFAQALHGPTELDRVLLPARGDPR